MTRRLTLLFMILCASPTAFGQTFEDTFTKKLSFENSAPTNVLSVSNINGDVHVEGYDGTEILMEVRRKISAKTQERLELGKKEATLGVADDYDTLVIYVSTGCYSSNQNKKTDNRWENSQENCDLKYDFHFDIHITVPKNQNLHLSTINRGDITVENVRGTLHLRNINGNISASGIENSTVTHAINGDVTLDYNTYPSSGTFYSLNGDIVANFPAGLAASVTFKSFNGDFYTNIDRVEQQPVLFKTSSSKDGTRFKAETRSSILLGGGGIPMDFETFNGNVYVKEQ